MDMLPKEAYKRVLYITFYLLIVLVLFFIFFKYILDILLPFIISWLIAMLIKPMITILHRRTKIPVSILSLIFVCLILAAIGTILFLLFDRLIFEVRGIVTYLNNNSEEWIEDIREFIKNLIDRIPFLKSLGKTDEIENAFSNFAQSKFAEFTTKIPNMLAKMVTMLPNILFVSLILIMASYYFCADYSTIGKFFVSIIPPKARDSIMSVKNKMKDASAKLVKGYLLTVFITFVQLYVGLAILKTNYVFTVALVTALVDVLPVIGVGTVLIPWALAKLLAGSYYQGFGLLIIFAVVSVVREILEPKIIGKSIGLHPLATLFSMYLGLKISGFLGMITFPVIIMMIKNFVPTVKKT